MPTPQKTKHQPLPQLGNRYHHPEPIGRGGMGTVSRVYDRLTGQMVALKHVVTSLLHPITNEQRLGLTREFQVLATLRHPYVIAVNDYGFDRDQQPFFTMELLEAAHPFNQGGQFLDLERKVSLLLQLLQALVYIHRRGVIHRDLKPGNVLVQNQTVKVLDFGLATVQAQHDSLSGTLLYLAPELMQGQPASTASDLYAVGIMAYELFAGWHPFPQLNSVTLANERVEPDFDFLGLTPELTAVLQTLLAAEPEQRYLDAFAAIQALCQAVDRPLPSSTDIQESLLNAALFVGREHELGHLEECLGQAIRQKGSAILVQGESGIGKTRLLAELRARALVQGVVVLLGRCRSDGDAYHLWRGLLRPFVLLAQPDDLEAAVLRSIIPDIDILLERQIPPAPPINAKAAQSRLHLTIIDLLTRISRRQPLLLLLEDLHWIDAPSLAMLTLLARQHSQTAVLVVGSARPGQRPGLAKQLATFTPLPLRRLPSDRVADLCTAFLGEKGRQPQLIEFLNRETEGNTFFIIEVMRSLAAEAGRLEQIPEMSLPLTIFAGGMRQMVERRLKRLPLEHEPLLQTAAVSGRQVDLQLLAHLFPAAPLEDWLNNCANAAVLERFEGQPQWHFSHDKLRDAVLNQLQSDHRVELHQTIAKGLETLYTSTPDPHYAELAHHFGKAQVVSKQIHYLKLAAEQAMATFANESALFYWQQLLPLLSDPEARAEVLLQQGTIYKLIGEWDTAHATLQTAVEMATLAAEPTLKAKLFQTLGNLERSKHRHTEALTWLFRARELNKQQRNDIELCKSLVELANIFYQQGEYPQALQHLDEALTAAQSGADQHCLALVYHNIGSVAYSQSQYDRAKAYYEKALAIRLNLSYEPEIADSYNNLGLVAFRQGKFPEAMDHLRQSLTIRRAVGDRWGIAASLSNLGMIPYQQRMLDQAEEYWLESLQIRRALNDGWGIASILDNLGLVAMAQDDLVKAKGSMNEAIQMREQLGDQQGLLISLGNRARVALESGEIPTAVSHYRASLKIAVKIGDSLGIVFALSGLGAAWAKEAKFELAVLLLSAAESRMEKINGRWESDEGTLQEAAVKQAKEGLPASVFQTAWMKGTSLSPSEVQQLVEVE